VKNLNNMSRGLTWFAVIALVVGSIGFGLRPTAEAAPSAQTSNNPNDHGNRNPLENIHVTGNIQSGGTFDGQMDVFNFYTQADQVLANGMLQGTLRDANGRRIGRVENVFVSDIPVTLGGSQQAQGAPAQGSNQGLAAAPVQTETVTPVVTTTVTPTGTPGVASCGILTLDLGPLHLNLLGLVVDLNAIHLTITAVPGPGNLLGNLLCAVAHLLDQFPPPLPGQLNQIIALLNRIVDLLGG